MIKGCQTLLKTFSVIFLVQLVFSAFLLLSPLPVSAQSTSQQKESIEFKPQVSIPGSEFSSGASVPVGTYNSATGKMESDLLGRYMLSIINYGLAAVAIVATVVLMGGGLLWLTSRGDSGQIGKAKGLIGGSLTGMILLLCSWIILNTINPELTEFQSIDATVIKPTNICCHPTSGAYIADKKQGCQAPSKICEGNNQCLMTDFNKFSCGTHEGNMCCGYALISDYSANIYSYSTIKTASTNNICPKTKEIKVDGKAKVLNLISFRPNYHCGNTGALTTGIAFGICVNKKIGSSCNSYGQSGYCYGDNCHLDTVGRKAGDPCGNELYSKCDPDEKQNGKTCVGDGLGRSCVSGLWCCKFRADGTRINK